MRTAILLAALAATPALATLPPASEAAKEQAKEAAAKAAWADKVGAYEVCQAQDRVAAEYRKSHPGAGQSAQMPPCANPGPYASQVTPNAQKPLEASEAHSPAGMAHSPPSNNATAAQLQGSSKQQ